MSWPVAQRGGVLHKRSVAEAGAALLESLAVRGEAVDVDRDIAVVVQEDDDVVAGSYRPVMS